MGPPPLVSGTSTVRRKTVETSFIYCRIAKIQKDEHVDRQVRRRHVQPQTLRHLEIALTGEWNNIPLNLIRRNIHSMRYICIPVINTFGGRTWYWKPHHFLITPLWATG